MIPYNKPSINKQDIDAVVKVLKSSTLTTGPKVIEFEKKLAQKFNAKYAVVCSSGTTALHLTYLAAGIKKGDEVITTPNTFVATTNSLLAIGAKPIFCDIRLDNYNIDESKIEEKINKKTKAIVAVHFSGHPVEMNTIWKIAKKHKLKVIEDGAHGLGAKYHGKKIGGLKSDFTISSFHPVKSITTGEGGVVFTNDKKSYELIKMLRSHGMNFDKDGFLKVESFGYNYRMNELEAALGISQLKRIDSFIKKRNQLARVYDKELATVKNITLPEVLKNNYSSRHLYVIRTKSYNDKIKLVRFLKKNNILVNHHYQALYQQPYYKKIKIKGHCPNAELYSKTAISLPIFPDLKSTEQEKIIKKIKEFYKQK